MEINYLNEIDSTHKYLIKLLKKDTLKLPIAFSAHMQTAGVGSRENSWKSMSGNLFLSFAKKLSDLPNDLALNSISIYHAFILKELLNDLGSKVFLKWPNDFYIGKKKIGGVITKLIDRDIVVVSIGLNLKNAPKDFEIIDINIDKNELLKSYFLKLKQDIFWKYIFRKYQVEFEKSRSFLYYDENEKKKVSLSNALLMKDGSIKINSKKVFSLR